MALMLVCDCGCGRSLDEKAAKVRGGLDTVTYCDAAVATWDAYAKAEDEKRASLSRAFETWRAEQFAALKAGGLATLPDEWLVPAKTDAPKDEKAEHGHSHEH
jgi:hypothetical protein